MRKTINFLPYTEVQIKAINEDGSVLCNLFGDGYHDTDICFPAGSAILSLTEQEKKEYLAWQQAQEALLLEQMPAEVEHEYAGDPQQEHMAAQGKLEPALQAESETEPEKAEAEAEPDVKPETEPAEVVN